MGILLKEIFRHWSLLGVLIMTKSACSSLMILLIVAIMLVFSNRHFTAMKKVNLHQPFEATEAFRTYITLYTWLVWRVGKTICKRRK